MTEAAFIAFRARFVPRFGSGDQNDKLRQDCERAQQSFWESVQFDKLSMYPAASVEVRYIAHETTREIEIWILVDARRVPPEYRGSLAKEVRALLPRGFGWIASPPISADELPVPKRAGSGPWHTSRAVRRLVFADVPDSQKIELPDDPAPRTVLSCDGPARIPSDSGLAVPLVMAIRSGYQPTPSFFEQLQAAAPAVLGIRIGRLSPNRLPVLRAVSNYYLEQNLGGLSTAIEGAYGRISASFHRYLLPDDLFNLLDISFATAGQDTTESLAFRFCSQIGGLTAFCQTDRAVRKDLRKFALEPPMSDFLDASQKQRERFLADDLQAFNVKFEHEDPLTRRFMLDAPYVYTFNEVLSLLNLPVADERGLPGLDSRPLPPFNSPSLLHDPVVSEAGVALGDVPRRAEQLRIGIRGRIRLGGNGRIEVDADRGGGGAHWHRITQAALTKHALVVGTTGSGKTTVTSLLLRELARTGVPFCVVEPVKAEYHRKMKPFAPIRRFTFEGTASGQRSPDFFVFDPLRIPGGVTVASHVSYLRAAFQAAFPMDVLGSMLLENGLMRYYTDRSAGTCSFGRFLRGSAQTFFSKELDKDKRVLFPSFRTFKGYFLHEYLPKIAFASSRETLRGSEQREDAINFFRRRFDLLEGGLLGEAISRAEERTLDALANGKPNAQEDDLDHLLDGNTVLELEGMADDDDKALVMALVLMRIFEKRQADSLLEREGVKPAGAGVLRHVLVIEEAHRLLSASGAHASRGEFGGIDPKAKAIRLFVNMLAEIRSQGQGIVMVEQIPTNLVSEVIKNTNLKIMLRLPSHEDREVLGATMNLTEEQIKYVATLRADPDAGIDFVAFDEQLDQPILLNLPLPQSTGERRAAPWCFNEFYAQPESLNPTAAAGG